jgi:hypothetical protein
MFYMSYIVFIHVTKKYVVFQILIIDRKEKIYIFRKTHYDKRSKKVDQIHHF